MPLSLKGFYSNEKISIHYFYIHCGFFMTEDLRATKFKDILALFLITLVFYGFSLPFSLKQPHFSPSNDFSNHAHYMHSFAESFKSGQIIPRTVVSPTTFTDDTTETRDAPTFQYYGFFDGVAALPFELLGFSDALSAVFSCVLVRFLGLFILYRTCLLMGASRLSGFLAAFSLLISPYTLTVFYGRGALSEVLAQPILTLIPYGFLLSIRGKPYQAIIAFSIAFFLLPLCHNIFFVYGLLFVGLLMLFSFQSRVILTTGIGTLLGICLSAWQWFPAHNTIKDIFIFGGFLSWKLGSFGVGLHSASLNGALGIPNRWDPAELSNPLPLFHTIGWWTLPFIFLSIKGIYHKEKVFFTFPFFMCSVIFFALTFWPLNNAFYTYLLPQIFDIVQDTSRLIGFVSLLGALSLAIVIPRISPRLFTAILILMLASQIPVFKFYFNYVSQQSWSNQEVLGSPINQFYTSPKIKPDENGFYSLELPSTYSTLFILKQNGKTLKFSPGFNHEILVQTKDITSPIKVSYHFDLKSCVLSLFGALGFLFILKLNRGSLNARKTV